MCLFHKCENVPPLSLFYLDLLDVWVPLPHLLHVSHQLIVKIVRMLLQHYFQLEHLPDVGQHFTQDFVSICLRKGFKQVLQVFIYFLSHFIKYTVDDVETCTHSHSFNGPAVLFTEDADGLLQCILTLLHIRHLLLVVPLLLFNTST